MTLKTILDNATDTDGMLETAPERDFSIVVSAHDFEGTPHRGEMVSTLTEAGKYGDVVKLAVTADSKADTIALLSATEQMDSHGDNVATIAMGKVGSHTRAVAPICGQLDASSSPVVLDDPRRKAFVGSETRVAPLAIAPRIAMYVAGSLDFWQSRNSGSS